MNDDASGLLKTLVDVIEKRFDLLDRRVKRIEETVNEIRESQQKGEGPQVKLLKEHVTDMRRALTAVTEMAEKIKGSSM